MTVVDADVDYWGEEYVNKAMSFLGSKYDSLKEKVKAYYDKGQAAYD